VDQLATEKTRIIISSKAMRVIDIRNKVVYIIITIISGKALQ
jgi:hypothetical protein